MAVLISMLRGINVGGSKAIPMASLKSLYEKLGFREVTTYIQSGNVIFKSNEQHTPKELAGQIEQIILETYNFKVPVIIRTLEEMKHIIGTNPLLNEHGIDVKKLHVTFLSEIPEQGRVEKIENTGYSPDVFVINDKEVYLYCPGGYGITKMSNTFFETKLKVSATTRNWQTVNKLLELAESTS